MATDADDEMRVAVSRQLDPDMPCDVCFGTPGKYPVINRYGQQLYNIRCPECGGSGKNQIR